MSPALKDLDGLCYLGWSLYSITYPTGRKGQRRGEILPLPAGNALFQKYNFPAKRYVFSKRRTALHYKFAEVLDLVAFPCFFTKAFLGKYRDQFLCPPTHRVYFPERAREENQGSR